MTQDAEINNELAETAEVSSVVEEQVELEETVEPEAEAPTEKVEFTEEQQAAFNKAFFKAKQAEREAEELRKQINELKAAKPTAQETKKSLADFEYDDEAYTDYLIDQKVEAKLAAQAQQALASTAAKTKQEATNTLNEVFNTKAVEYANTNPAYNEAIANAQFVQYSPTLSEAVLHEGPALDHHLLVNPQLVDKLNGLSGYALVKEINTITTNLSKTATARVSKAPTPPPVVSGGSRPTKDVSDPNLSMAEFYALEMARLSKK